MTTPKTGAERIAAERHRQIDAEGWTADHDDEHHRGELALVAALYATPIPLYRKDEARNGRRIDFSDPWPTSWDDDWDRRPEGVATVVQRIRALEKAGALIAAEIDRLLRSKP